ncbi:transposable element P transposase isoform X2 [Bacillus rossius redtenbacheri]|uniref:transposable element P transposase isoform X2 n=1 Tax=Bacillus rossius redtenbacheri TaxID=93214 RepID=UPI002FDDAF61
MCNLGGSDLRPSSLGTREYWDDTYSTEMENFFDHGDVGEVWFGEDTSLRVARWLASCELVRKDAPVVDLGSGNGMQLIDLAREGFTDLTGVDYSQTAVDLARAVAEKERVLTVHYELLDIVADQAPPLRSSAPDGLFAVALDKGTYDAISLSPDDARGKRTRYVERVRSLLRPEGLLVLTSCNWTEEELVAHFVTSSYNGKPSCEKDISELPCMARADTLQKASNEHNSQIQAMDVDPGIEDNIDSCSFIEKQGQETATNTMDISFFESDGVWPLDTVDLQMNEETGNQMADATIRNEHSGSRLKNRNNSLLKKTGTTRQMKLTPKAQKLYSEATKLLRQKRCLSLRVKQYKTRVKLAEKFSESSFFDNLINKVDLVTYNFIMSQIRTQKHKPKGRRFTLNDKIFALSVLKQSPKGYKLLSKYFSLPSKRLLNNLLQKLDFKPGINMRVMAHLKETVTKLNQKDRYCCLMFDEMSLHPNIQYGESVDRIEGFQDLGNGKQKPTFADHALVFMVRGIRRRWKQPVAYMFTNSTFKAPQLVQCIKNVISTLQETGLKVVATICDQSSTNTAAVNSLLRQTQETYLRAEVENRNMGFVINGQEIVPLYDPPHLLKGIRNNLLSKCLQFRLNGSAKKACWKHIEQFYELDSRSGETEFRACPKLTDEHIIPHKIKKMKVSCCSQVFSQRLSATMRMACQWGKPGETLDKDAVDTADLLLFMDRLFDSVNGTMLKPQPGKPLRSAVTSQSPHVEFWKEAVEVLSTFRFVNEQTKKEETPPSVKNWIVTLKGLKYLWEKLRNVGFKFLANRNFNQDPLENLFGTIRSHGIRNVNPTCSNFKTSLKSILLNNFVSIHSVNANCEEDDSVGALNSLKNLLCAHQEETTEARSESPSQEHSIFDDKISKECTPISHLCNSTNVYVSGYIARTVLKKIKGCKTCREILCTDTSSPNDDIITARSYNPKSLSRPNSFFTDICKTLFRAVDTNLPHICHENDIKTRIFRKVMLKTEFLSKCSIHNLHSCVCDTVIKFCIHSWCNTVNRILTGKYAAPKLKDPIKNLARVKFLKSRHKK